MLAAWRRVLLATAATSVLVLACPHAVRAQDIVNVDDIIQTDGGGSGCNPTVVQPIPCIPNSRNANTRSYTASDTDDLSLDPAAPTSVAAAIAEIDGPTTEDPVLVSQTNTSTNGGTRENLNRESFEADATALSGPAADIAFALSSATAEASVNSEVNQSNSNTGTGGGANTLILIQGQIVDQENHNFLSFDVDASATGNTATVVSLGDVNELGDGVNAASVASAEADVDSKVTQSEQQ